MALIKSALELALERTAHVEVDEIALAAQKAKTEGRKAAGRFLDDPESFDVAKAVSAANAADRTTLMLAFFEVLVSQIQLPMGIFDTQKFQNVGKGLVALARIALSDRGPGAKAGVNQVETLVQHIPAFITKYQEETKRVEQAIKTQWAPKFKEKERQLAARMGQDVRIDPMADPEFAAFYKQNVESLRKNYADALEQAKSDLRELCGFAPAED